ncbi:hypothetical protein GDO86_012099 [Hymenochirus boettgeri]|uniref:RRM domain-containing protein n=1 Tax=Hymenochirus boettgeri TaxID=247094 RepID=A0A8T2JGW6_9PIPI|nr:hypothetical protein GDO86_012099 [Hymenochirus boettgeri]
MAALLGDDDFDQFDKPGAERFRRKRSADDWDSELEDDLLEEDILPGKKNPSDLSDEELNDDLLQSDEDEQETGYGVAISLNATAGGLTSFELSKSVNEDPDALDPEAEEGGELAENAAEPVAGNDHFTDPYETNELADESAEYIEIEPLDEFQEEDYSQQKLTEDQEYTENFVEEAEEAPEEIADEGLEAQDVTNDSEEVPDEHQEVAAETKEDSDEEDEEEEDGGRIRFKTERKEGTIIRLSDATRARRNIPETLELSAEAKASLQEFEEMERQRKGRYSAKRWKRGGNNSGPRGMGEQRHENNERRNMREQRPPQGQPIRSLFQQQQIQPLLPMQRSRNPSSDAMTTPTPQEKQRMGGKALLSTPPQPKNIHINPHFKGNVAPVQVPLLPVPNQPRPQAGPPRFPASVQPPMQHLHQQHHLTRPPNHKVLVQQPFRARLQSPRTSTNIRQRPGLAKPRQGVPLQNIGIGAIPQMSNMRNSNLRELPVAPTSSLGGKPNSAPSAQVKPIGTTVPQARASSASRTQVGKQANITIQVKEELKPEEQFPDEDEETRNYRLKIEEQKRLREAILRQKELRRQQQAGARKKELMERLSQQQQTPSAGVQEDTTDQDKPTGLVVHNITPVVSHTGAQIRPNVKTRLLNQTSETLQTANSPLKIHPFQQDGGTGTPHAGLQKKIVKQIVKKTITNENPIPKVQQVRPALMTAQLGSPQTAKVASVNAVPQTVRAVGSKRSVMQRTNSGSGNVEQPASKVRLIKLTGALDGGDSVHLSEGNLGTQMVQQGTIPQQRPQLQQRLQQQQRETVRKVTLVKSTVQQQQHQYNVQQFQGPARPLRSHSQSVNPQLVNIVQGQHQPKKVVMRGRGRGLGGQMGRGRLMPNKQNLRVVECNPQPCAVALEGLSSSTTDNQLKNMLTSVGPIRSFQMLPHQRKAIATFKEPMHAVTFQQKFHRHMIDLSHINVSLVSE